MSKTLYDCIARAISVATKGRSQLKKQKQKKREHMGINPIPPPHYGSVIWQAFIQKLALWLYGYWVLGIWLPGYNNYIYYMVGMW